MNRVSCETFEDMIDKLAVYSQFYINLDFDALLSVQVCVVAPFAVEGDNAEDVKKNSQDSTCWRRDGYWFVFAS